MTLNDYIEMIPGATRDKQRFMELFSVILTQVIDLQNVVAQINTSWSIENANGGQLDVIASSLGLSRLDTTDGVNVSDADFRDFIKKKLLVWSWDGTNKNAHEIAQQIASGSTYKDNQNGTVTLGSVGSQPADVKKLFPITAGVSNT